MNKAVSWRIKGVDFDAREAAIEAARRSGMSLGEWLNTVIAEQAAEDGVSEDDYDSDDRLDAVTRRLSDLSGRRREPRAPRGRDRVEFSDHDDFDFDDEQNARRARLGRRPARSRGPHRDIAQGRDISQDSGRDRGRDRHALRDSDRDAPREVSWRDDVDPNALLENAIAAFDRRANRSSERTARALADVADLIETSHRTNRRDDTALASISDRLAQIERRVARPADTSGARPVREALERLEARIETLARHAESGPAAPVAAAPAPVAPIARRAERPAPVDAHDARIAEIEAKLSAITHAPRAVAAPAPPPSTRRPLAAMIAEVADRQRQLDGDTPARAFRARAAEAVTPPHAETNAAEGRLKALIERLERAAGASPAVAPADLSGLQGNINMLAERIEQMRNEVVARAPTPGVSDDQIAQIRNEIAAMSRAVADLAPRASVAALDAAVRDMAHRIETSRIDGIGDAILAPLENLMRDVRSVLKDFDPRASIAALDREIRAIAAKMEKFEGGNATDPDAVRGIFEQTREVRDLLGRVLASQLPGERVERELAALAERIDVMAVTGVDASERHELADRVSEIRSLIADPQVQGRTLAALESQVEAIARKIDTTMGERFETMQRAFAAELTQAREASSAVPPDFAAQLGERIDAALGNGLVSMQRAITRALERPAAPAVASDPKLAEMLQTLVTRMDAVAGARHDDSAVAALQAQIERMASVFDRSGKTAETLASLERSVGELFTRLEETKHFASDAAEMAARRAIQDGVRSPSDAVASPALSRELADLRSLQDSSDHRTHETLTAVHETLERVVERLSTLEDDLAEVREGHDDHDARNARAGAPISDLARAMQDAQEQPFALRGDRRRPPPVDDVVPEPDVLIEPGTPFAARRPSARDVAPAESSDKIEYRPQSSFILAARRAAQAAATTVADGASPASQPAAGKSAAAKSSAEGPKSAGSLDQVRAYYTSRKRPILLSLAALMVIFGAWQVGRVMLDERATPDIAAIPKISAPARPDTIPADKPAASMAPAPTPAPPAPPAAVDTPAPVAIPSGRKADAAPPMMTNPSAATLDRAPVGSIAPAVDTNGIVRAMAVQGDPVAEYELAIRYSDGKLLARDLKLASEWFQKAAAQGIVPAQYRLGALYERGLGVTKDSVQAKAWYQRAAEKGNARAMHNLAVMFADGSDGKPGYADAIVWFKRAAEYGVRDSQYNLAILYARGLGTPVDFVQSYVWFAAAAAQGDEDAAKKRDDVVARLSPADLARAKALYAAFVPRTPDPAANDVAPPPGGWESVKTVPRTEPKATARPKVSAL